MEKINPIQKDLMIIENQILKTESLRNRQKIKQIIFQKNQNLKVLKYLNLKIKILKNPSKIKIRMEFITKNVLNLEN